MKKKWKRPELQVLVRLGHDEVAFQEFCRTSSGPTAISANGKCYQDTVPPCLSDCSDNPSK